MKTYVRMTAQLGELVVAAFDKAAQYSADPHEVSRLATTAVMHILRRARPEVGIAPRGARGYLQEIYDRAGER